MADKSRARTAGGDRFGGMAGREATVEDLYSIRGKAEIVNGELVVMTPAGGLHGYAAGAVYASLFAYARATKRGYALPDDVGFVVNLPNRRYFSPDVAFWTGGPLTAKFPEGAPIFAVEVRSEEDHGRPPNARWRPNARTISRQAPSSSGMWTYSTSTSFASIAAPPD